VWLGSRGAGKQGSREAGKQGRREGGKEGSREAGKQVRALLKRGRERGRQQPAASRKGPSAPALLSGRPCPGQSCDARLGNAHPSDSSPEMPGVAPQFHRPNTGCLSLEQLLATCTRTGGRSGAGISAPGPAPAAAPWNPRHNRSPSSSADLSPFPESLSGSGSRRGPPPEPPGRL